MGFGAAQTWFRLCIYHQRHVSLPLEIQKPAFPSTFGGCLESVPHTGHSHPPQHIPFQLSVPSN